MKWSNEKLSDLEVKKCWKIKYFGNMKFREWEDPEKISILFHHHSVEAPKVIKCISYN